MTSVQTARAALPASRSQTLPDLSFAPDEAEVARIRQGIRLTDRASLVSFGDAAQNGVASFADTILKQTLNKDAGPAGELLGGILEKARGIDPKQLNKLGLIDRLMGGAKAKVERYRARFTSVYTQIERISLSLERHCDTLKRDIAMLDGLFARNLDQIRGLEAHVVAATRELEEATGTTLPALQSRASATGDTTEGQVLAQQASDLSQGIERLERRLHDLRLSRMVALQAMPQIRLIQNGDAAMVEKLQSARSTTIPMWKSGMVIALAINRRNEALAGQTALDDATNEFLRSNAEQLRIGTVGIEKAMQRGIVDVETLAFVNEQFIRTIDEVRTVQRDGATARAAAERELVRIEGELKRTVLGSNR